MLVSREEANEKVLSSFFFFLGLFERPFQVVGWHLEVIRLALGFFARHFAITCRWHFTCTRPLLLSFCVEPTDRRCNDGISCTKSVCSPADGGCSPQENLCQNGGSCTWQKRRPRRPSATCQCVRGFEGEFCGTCGVALKSCRGKRRQVTVLLHVCFCRKAPVRLTKLPEQFRVWRVFLPSPAASGVSRWNEKVIRARRQSYLNHFVRR